MTELTGKLGLKILYQLIAAPTVYIKPCVLFLLHGTSSCTLLERLTGIYPYRSATVAPV